MCFQIDGKYALSAKCVKSRIMNKVIDYVLSVNTIEHNCVVLKGMLQSPRLNYHMKTIGTDQSLINSALFEHRLIKNISKSYQNNGKFDNQQQFKDILKTAMLSTS